MILDDSRFVSFRPVGVGAVGAVEQGSRAGWCVYIFKGGKFKELKIIFFFFFNSRESRALDKTIHVALKNLFYSLHIYCVEVGSKTADMKFLTKDQKSFYSENGYIKLENILTNDEIHHMSKEYDDIFQVGT